MASSTCNKTLYTEPEIEAELADVGEVQQINELRREFRPRHVFMFSIACAIGTGLIIGSGTALVRGGPGSVLVSYLLVGATVFFVMTGLGEMAAFLPMNKGFSGYATRIVDPALGFATGWNYFLKYCIATPTNLTASGIVIQYWRADLNMGIWIPVFAVVIISINIFHVSTFGETEFFMASAKVIIMTILILVCFVIALGGGPNHHRSGFQYWKNPGAFNEYLLKGTTGRFLGWWACMCQACFAYTGTEVVGMTFGETPNPKKNIPKAVKNTFWRIACFYILGVLILGMAVPSNNSQLIGATKKSTSAAASPFVVAANIAGITILPDIINASLLVFTLSAASSDIYCASRSLYGLAKDGQAPTIFAKTLANGNPIYAVAISSSFIALAFMSATKTSVAVFQYFVSLVTIFAVLNWIAILVSHISFRRAVKVQNISLQDLPYVGLLQPYGSYYSLLISCLVVLFSGYDAFIPHFRVDVLVLRYLGNIIFILNIVGWKMFKRTKRVKAREIDMMTDRREFEEMESPLEGNPQKSFWKRTLQRLRG